MRNPATGQSSTKSIVLALALALVSLQPASASAPVPKAIVGCVSNGTFTSESGYVIKLRRRPGELMNLSRWNGMRLRVTGNLLPGDDLYLTGSPAVLGRCR